MVTTPTDDYGRTTQSGQTYVADLTGRAKVMDRIQKVLAITNSPNEQEAASAAAMLSRMLEEHNLSMADIEAKGAKGPGIRQSGHDLGKAAFKWKMDLAEGIAEFYYCAPLVDRKTKTVAFVGRPENVEALTALYSWVIDQIRAIATTERRSHYDATGEHIDPLRWQLGFGEGAVDRLIDRLRELKARQQEDLSHDQMGNVTAMVIHRQSEVSDYLEEKFGYRTDGKLTKREADSEARWQKYREERDAADLAKEELLLSCKASGDMEPFYLAYPEMRPEEIAKRELANEKWLRDERKKEERNARRRTGSWRAGPAVDHEKEQQADMAREVGRKSAGKINLQPFIEGAKDRKQVG